MRNFGRRNRFDRGFRDNFKKPVKEGEEYNVKIDEIGSKGDGIARIENFVVFVSDTKEGEECRVRIKIVRPRFAVAEKISDPELRDVSEDDVEEESSEEEAPEELEEAPEEEDEK
jgi:predicted RNA-binding protein with TRAM domain